MCRWRTVYRIGGLRRACRSCESSRCGGGAGFNPAVERLPGAPPPILRRRKHTPPPPRRAPRRRGGPPRVGRLGGRGGVGGAPPRGGGGAPPVLRPQAGEVGD